MVRRRHNGASARAAIERYLADIVEALDLCPWTGPARRAGRVRIEVVAADESCEACVSRLVGASTDANLDALLLVFDLPADDPRQDPRAFGTFLRAFQERYRMSGAEAFYCVLFHPALAEPEGAATPHGLVRTIRRAPVPFFQCLRASVMEQARAQAQGVAARKIDEQIGRRVVLTDPHLSDEIARRNFERHGTGKGRDELESRLRELRPAPRSPKR